MAQDADPPTLKRARTQKALVTHPDKVGLDTPGANQASGRVNKVRALPYV